MIPSMLSIAQDKDVLFTIGNHEVEAGEFVYQYRKAGDIARRSGQFMESPEDYLVRYVNFKLKVVEALEAGKDKEADFEREFEQYRRDLARPFMQDQSTLDSLVWEAWERGFEELEASHILITLGQSDSPADTLEAYRKAEEVRALASQGLSFDSLARLYSGDPSAANNGGYLGYFSSMQMVYPFENSAFSLKPGQISKPVRTQFGYHIIKLHNRIPARGRARIAHIMIRAAEGMPQEDLLEQRKKAFDVYARLKEQPVAWDELVLSQSDDLGTRERGGELGWFMPGRLLSEIDDAAFALANPGDISEPFKTAFGWHIVKLLDKEQKNTQFELEREELMDRVKRDSRSRLAVVRFIEKAEAGVGFREYPPAVLAMMNAARESLVSGAWQWEGEQADLSQPLFSTRKRRVLLSDFVSFLTQNQMPSAREKPEAIMERYLTDFRSKIVMEDYQDMLEELEPAYRYVLTEYRDGMLLFDIMEQRVWNKALEDSVGLERFYDNFKENYRIGERAQAQIFVARTAAARTRLISLYNQSQDKDEFLQGYDTLREELSIDVEVRRGLFEVKQHPYLSEFESLSEINALDLDDAYVVAVVENSIPEDYLPLRQIRGRVISDYQEYLEKQWLEDLRKKYPVFINRSVFESIRSKIEGSN